MAVSGKKTVCVDRLQSVKHAWCEPCEGEEDERQPAAGYCEICEEYMCQTCLTCHRRSRLGKTHTILSLQQDISSSKTTSNATDGKPEDELTEVCPIHTDEVMKYYCQDHDEICCVDCRVKSHTTCKHFEKISQLCISQNTLNKFDYFDERLNNLNKHIDGEIEKATGYTKVNETQYQKQQDDVNNFVEDVINTLARLKREFKDKSAERKEKNTKVIELVTKEFRNLKQEIETLQSEFVKLQSTGKRSKQFVLMKKSEKDLCKWEEEEKRIEERNLIELRVFRPDSQMKILFDQVLGLGVLIEAALCCKCQTLVKKETLITLPCGHKHCETCYNACELCGLKFGKCVKCDKVFNEAELVRLICSHNQCVLCAKKPCGSCGLLLVKHREKQPLFQGVSNPRRGSVVATSIHFGWTQTEMAFHFSGNKTIIWPKSYGRVPNCVLIESCGTKVHSFGSDAEEKSYELAQHSDFSWYFFRDIMISLDKEFNEDIKLEAENMKSLSAKNVISSFIKYLKTNAERLLHERTSLTTDDIYWIIAVPATLEEHCVKFMRDVAEMGGIPKTSVTFMYDSDAAVISQKNLSYKKFGLIDVGAKRTDITVYQGVPLKVIHTSSSVNSFGSNVREGVLNLLQSLLGPEKIETFKNVLYDDFVNEIDSRIRSFTDDKEKVNFKIPDDDALKEEIVNAVTQARFAGKQLPGNINVVGDKMSVKKEFFVEHFVQDTNQIVQHIRVVHDNVDECPVYLMVGEASESVFLQQYIRKMFPEINLFIHNNPRFAAVEGAAIAGMKFLH